MDKNYGLEKLEKFENPDFPNSIFYKKNGVIVIQIEKINKIVWFSFEEIFKFLNLFFSMDYSEILGFMKYWLKESMKLKDFIPFFGLSM